MTDSDSSRDSPQRTLAATTEQSPWAVFDLLWTASKTTRAHFERTSATSPTPSTASSAAAAIRIPDTVFVHHSRITRWYFTAKDGTIKVKSRAKLTTANVIEHFEQQAKRQRDDGKRGLIQTVRMSATHEGAVEFLVVEPEALHDLVTDSAFSGLVQTFIEPRSDAPKQGGGGSHNHVIVANWTPNVLYIEKRHNTLDIYKTPLSQQATLAGVTLADRTSTDVASRFVRSGALSSTYTIARAEQACRAIADEMHRGASGGSLRVVGLVAYFKIDSQDRMCLLCCDSVRTVDTSAVAAPSVGSSSSSPALEHSRPTTKRAAPPKAAAAPPPVEERPCTICKTLPTAETKQGVSKIARRHVLLSLEHVAKPGGAAAEAEVPPAVRVVDSSMTAAAYSELKDDPAWLDEVVPVCHVCVDRLFRAVSNNRRPNPGATKGAPTAAVKSRPSSQASVQTAATHSLPPVARRRAPSTPNVR